MTLPVVGVFDNPSHGASDRAAKLARYDLMPTILPDQLTDKIAVASIRKEKYSTGLGLVLSAEGVHTLQGVLPSNFARIAISAQFSLVDGDGENTSLQLSMLPAQKLIQQKAASLKRPS